MTRRSAVLDRVVVFLTGLGLAAIGLLMVAWRRGMWRTGEHLAALPDPSSAWWWPWLIAAVGIALVAIGLRWLAAHRPAPKARRLNLAAGAPLTADATAVADAAARILGGDSVISKANASATLLRGVPTVTLTATVPARRGLRPGLERVDSTARTIRTMLGDAVAVRSILHVDRKGGPAVR